MAKKVKVKKKGSNRILSVVFHLVVLVVMVSLYDAARAMLKKIDPKLPASEEASNDKKTSTSKDAPVKKNDGNLGITPIPKSNQSGNTIKNKLSDIKQDGVQRGSSMEDQMAEKPLKAKEDTIKAVQEMKEK
jgi:hypothetical protein